MDPNYLILLDYNTGQIVKIKLTENEKSKSEDYEALAANVKKMYGMSKEEIRQMGENAKAYYMKYFEKEMVIDCVNEMLNRK